MNVYSWWSALWQASILFVAAVAAGQAEAPADPAPAAGGEVLTVARDGSGQYWLIQAAIDAAPPGATIRIAPGEYREHLEIGKALTLEGPGWERATVSPRNAGGESSQNLQEKLREIYGARMQRATTEAEREAIKADLEEAYTRYAEKAVPVLSATGAQDIEVRGLKLTLIPAAGARSPANYSIVDIRDAQVRMADCAVVGSPRNGVQIGPGADVEIRHCLIAAVWDRGVQVQADARASILDSDIRNCRYAGILIRPGSGPTRVERCRISGAAWHAIRYDDVAPNIIGNVIFDNSGGIYASGKTAATVRGNLFYQNEMGGMSCWEHNRDLVERNTFLSNRRAGMSVIDNSRPVVHRNIFCNHPLAIVCACTSDESSAGKTFGQPQLADNLFWRNDQNVARSDGQPVGPGEGKLFLEMEPMFADPEAQDFSLADDSPARRDDIGAADPLALESPWPLQPAETAARGAFRSRSSEYKKVREAWQSMKDRQDHGRDRKDKGRRDPA